MNYDRAELENNLDLLRSYQTDLTKERNELRVECRESIGLNKNWAEQDLKQALHHGANQSIWDKLGQATRLEETISILEKHIGPADQPLTKEQLAQARLRTVCEQLEWCERRITSLRH